MDEEEYVNVEITATMSVETYSMLTAVLIDWFTQHPDSEARSVLNDIKFTRTR